MNARIRNIALVVIVLFGVLFVRLNDIQVYRAAQLGKRPDNSRQVLRDFDRPRGTIQTADGTVVAYTEPPAGQQREYVRRYPTGDLFAQVTGYFTLSIGSTGVERAYGDDLSGQSSELELKALTNLLSDEEITGDVVLSLRNDAQVAAKEALGDRRGSVVALDPRTGEVLALWSFPSFDPNELSAVDSSAAIRRKEELDASPDKPLLAKSYGELFAPGSTFKVVTAAAGLRTDTVSDTRPTYPVTREFTAPGTSRPLTNFGGSSCGGALPEITRVSCNTAFAEMGTRTIGPDGLVDAARAFGFGETPPIDIQGAAISRVPEDYGRRLGPFPDGEGGSAYENSAGLAQVAIGQGDARATPLQMALVAAAVGNDGAIMAPHVVAEVRDAEGDVVRRIAPQRWKRPLDEAQAADLRGVLDGVVSGGTAEGLAIPNVEVGGKTGTAQTVSGADESHAWIIGYAGPEGAPAEVAVAVIVEAQQGVSEQTGGRVAAPIARRVMETVLFPAAGGSSTDGAGG